MKIWLERFLPTWYSLSAQSVECRYPEDMGAPRKEERYLKGQRHRDDSRERSGLQKYFNPEYSTAVICYLVHTGGSTKSVQKISYCKQRRFCGMLKWSRRAARITEQNNVAPNLCAWPRMAASRCSRLVPDCCNPRDRDTNTWVGKSEVWRESRFQAPLGCRRWVRKARKIRLRADAAVRGTGGR